MKTVAIQIGNTDDKLTQMMWSAFIKQAYATICRRAAQVHFSGYSDPAESWQNAAFIFEISEGEAVKLWDEMMKMAGAYNQDSIAWTEGRTLFVEAIK